VPHLARADFQIDGIEQKAGGCIGITKADTLENDGMAELFSLEAPGRSLVCSGRSRYSNTFLARAEGPAGRCCECP